MAAATRSKAPKMRQARIDFSKAVPATTTQSSPSHPTSRTTRTNTRAASSSVAKAKPRAEIATATTSSRTRSSTQFLGASTRKKQMYLVHSSSSDGESDVSPTPPVLRSTNPVDSENLRGSQWSGGRAAFVYDETDSEEEDNIPVKTSSARKRKRPDAFVVDDDSESAITEDDGSDSVQEVATPPRKSRKLEKRHAEDLADDLEFLKSSPPAINPKGVESKKDARSKALEELRRKREKRKPKTASSQRRQKMVVLDSDEETSGKGHNRDDRLQSESDFMSDDELDEVDGHQVFREQDGDEDFIEDDEDDQDAPLGVPTSSIPIAFTGWATAKPKELFRFGVEWFVQKKINPAFNRDDDIYKLTWQKLNDEITGLVGSKFTSSAWNRDFTFSLQSRPRIETTRVQTIMQDCEACNRTGHPATWRVQFLGQPYNTVTYEDVEQDSSDDDDEEAEQGRITRDQRGHHIPPESRTYYMGATCFKNARVAHRLKHWRYSLGEWVMSYLADIGELDSEKIVQRDGWTEAKRRNHAIAIVQRMEEAGEVVSLYRTMRMEVNSARGAADWD